MKQLILLFFASILLFSSCSEVEVDPQPVYNPIFSISGKINNPENISIPSSAKIIVMWMVTSTVLDYGYYWTDCKVDLKTKTFKLKFNTNPNDSCLNTWDTSMAGVGYVLLVDNFNFNMGILQADPKPYIIGGISDRAIIFTKGAFKTMDNWVKDFNEGFNYSKGWYNMGPGFDGWQPCAADSVEIQLGDFNSLKFPNWS